MSKIEHDDITGTATTGHEWDGIRELNTPLPRWWLYTFYACIIWAAIYTVLYPAWPLLNGATPGILGYSSRAAVTESIAQARAAQGEQLPGARQPFRVGTRRCPADHGHSTAGLF